MPKRIRPFNSPAAGRSAEAPAGHLPEPPDTGISGRGLRDPEGNPGPFPCLRPRHRKWTPWAIPRFHRLLSRLLSDYGMVLVLLLLGACFSYVTWDEQHPTGVEAAEQLEDRITREFSPGSAVLVVAREHDEDAIFADSLRQRLKGAGMKVLGTVKGQPSDARGRLQALSRSGAGLDAIACTDVTGPLGRLRPAGGQVSRTGRSQGPDAAELPLAQLSQARQPAERGQPDRGHRHSGGGDDHGHHHGGHRPFGRQP